MHACSSPTAEAQSCVSAGTGSAGCASSRRASSASHASEKTDAALRKRAPRRAFLLGAVLGPGRPDEVLDHDARDAQRGLRVVAARLVAARLVGIARERKNRCSSAEARAVLLGAVLGPGRPDEVLEQDAQRALDAQRGLRVVAARLVGPASKNKLLGWA
jgi:hypothetical protein